MSERGIAKSTMIIIILLIIVGIGVLVFLNKD